MTSDADRPSQKVTVYLPAWMHDAIKEWEMAYRPKFDQSEVVRILLDAGLRSVTADPTPFGLRPVSTEDVSPPRREGEAIGEARRAERDARRAVEPQDPRGLFREEPLGQGPATPEETEAWRLRETRKKEATDPAGMVRAKRKDRRVPPQ